MKQCGGFKLINEFNSINQSMNISCDCTILGRDLRRIKKGHRLVSPPQPEPVTNHRMRWVMNIDGVYFPITNTHQPYRDWVIIWGIQFYYCPLNKYLNWHALPKNINKHIPECLLSICRGKLRLTWTRLASLLSNRPDRRWTCQRGDKWCPPGRSSRVMYRPTPARPFPLSRRTPILSHI